MTKSGLSSLPSSEIRFISSIMAFETFSVTVPQISTTRLKRSPEEMMPSWYCFSMFWTDFSAFSTRDFFSPGMTKSSMPREKPAFVA